MNIFVQRVTKTSNVFFLKNILFYNIIIYIVIYFYFTIFYVLARLIVSMNIFVQQKLQACFSQIHIF